ncbi:hypothetical protein GGF31_003727 [Allomyces arbusculus]|nr:hypothetical protein GGF31_003727 [Allomyces arbusculus]
MARSIAAWFSRLRRIRGTIFILKNAMLLVNVLSLLASVGLLAVGIYGYSSDSVVGIVSSNLPLSCILLGLVVAVVSLVGCFGVANEARLFIRIYFILLTLLIFGQIVLGAVAASHKEDVEYYITQAWTNAYETDQSVLRRIQKYLKCCGLHDSSEMAVPDACPTTTPCIQSMKQKFTQGIGTIATTAIALGVIETFCLVAAGMLVYFAQLADDARETELLDEARQLALAERERSKEKRYNFETPFDDGDE